METKNEVTMRLNKIWAIINNMAQDRRIHSNELDDFNQAYSKLSDLIDSLFQGIEMIENEVAVFEKQNSVQTAQRFKMELCLELCGMSKKGIIHLMNYPIDFLELALTKRLKEGRPLENDRDFYWLDQLWNGINIQIESDIDSFKQATFFKNLYHETTDTKLKKHTLSVMNGYAKDLLYLKSKLGKEIDETELLNTITTHWYEEYRNCTAIENN